MKNEYRETTEDTNELDPKRLCIKCTIAIDTIDGALNIPLFSKVVAPPSKVFFSPVALSAKIAETVKTTANEIDEMLAFEAIAKPIGYICEAMRKTEKDDNND